ARDSVPGLDEPSRLLATPVERGGQRLVLVVGATSQDRTETLAGFRGELLVAGPIALLLATVAGGALAGGPRRPGGAPRRPARERPRSLRTRPASGCLFPGPTTSSSAWARR